MGKDEGISINMELRFCPFSESKKYTFFLSNFSWTLFYIFCLYQLMIALICNNQSDMIREGKNQRHIEVKFFSGNEEVLLQDILHPSDHKESNEQLIIANTIFHLNDQENRKFVLLEAKKVEELNQKEAALQTERARISQLEEQMKYLMRVIGNLQRRTSLHHYNPGVFQQLTLNAQSHDLYKIRGNFLMRRPLPKGRNTQEFQDPLSRGIISDQRIDQTLMRFSFKIKISDTADDKVRAFIGLCTKIPEGILEGPYNKNMYKFIIPKESPQKIEEQSRILKTKKEFLCEMYYLRAEYGWNLTKGQNFQKTCLKKGDVLVLTVNLEQSHLTWYRNEISMERSYFENPHTNIYPFVYLQPNVEAELNYD